MNPEMTTTKIDRASLEKLRMLAVRESRSAPSQLKVLIDSAFKANPAGVAVEARLADAMDEIVAMAESGAVTDEARADYLHAKKEGAVSWGSENGVIVGLLPDGTRVDVTGTPL